MIAPHGVGKLEVAWDQTPRGLFTFGLSLMGGPDKLGASAWDQTFGGTYDDITSPGDGTVVTRVSINRGRDDPLAEMVEGQLTAIVRDPIGKFNRKNTSSVLFGKLNEMRACRYSMVGPGLLALTKSG